MIKEEYYKPHLCPVCGKFEFPIHGSYDICDVCGWEDDPVQEDDPEFGGANWEGLKGYRALYKAGMHEATNEEKRKWLKENRIYESNKDSEDRFDDEEEKNSGGNGGGNGGGHGNTRLPFGLCQRLGIEIGKDWSPSDAWDALADEGISPSGAFGRLKEGKDPGNNGGVADSKISVRKKFTKESANEHISQYWKKEKNRLRDIEKAKSDLSTAEFHKRTSASACETLTNEIQRMEAKLKAGEYSEGVEASVRVKIDMNYERLKYKREEFEEAKKNKKESEERIRALESEAPGEEDKKRFKQAVETIYPDWDSCDNGKEVLERAEMLASVDNDYKEIASVIRSAETYNHVAYLKPKKAENLPSREEIVNQVGGPDKTAGSCASLCITYIANELGYEMKDFRGGKSQGTFSHECVSLMRAVGCERSDNRDGFKAARGCLEKMEMGKEYWFEAGKHAAIVRKTDSGYEYLELQSFRNGWFALTDNTLKRRFGLCKTRTIMGQRFDISCHIVDVEKAKKSSVFPAVFGYINTEVGKEKKGAGGYAK